MESLSKVTSGPVFILISIPKLVEFFLLSINLAVIFLKMPIFSNVKQHVTDIFLYLFFIDYILFYRQFIIRVKITDLFRDSYGCSKS